MKNASIHAGHDAGHSTERHPARRFLLRLCRGAANNARAGLHLRHVKQPRDELSDFLDNNLAILIGHFERMVEASAYAQTGGSARDVQASAKAAGLTIAESMALMDLLGRRRVYLEMDGATAGMTLAEDRERMVFEATSVTPVAPNVPFSEAVADIVRREPRLAGTAEAVAELYQTEHSFAMAFSTEQVVTEKVQKTIANLIDSGTPVPTASAVIEKMTDFPAWYSETVYRTNTNTAYAAGRFQQAFDPDVADVMPAMERTSVMDDNLRSGRRKDRGENHRAAHGLVAATADPIWQFASPPSGYNCRCATRLVSRFELERRGLLVGGVVQRREPTDFFKFQPHENFGEGRPDQFLYSGEIVT